MSTKETVKQTQAESLEALMTDLSVRLRALGIVDIVTLCGFLVAHAADRARHPIAEAELGGKEIRPRLAVEVSAVPFEEAFALLSELLVYVCLDDGTSVEELERAVLMRTRELYARCKAGPAKAGWSAAAARTGSTVH